MRDMLAAHYRDTGKRIGLLELVSSSLAALRLLPEQTTLIEAAKAHARMLGCVKSKLISEAVKEFVGSRKAEPKPGKRARFSPVHARNVESWPRAWREAFTSWRWGNRIRR